MKQKLLHTQCKNCTSSVSLRALNFLIARKVNKFCSTGSQAAKYAFDEDANGNFVNTSNGSSHDNDPKAGYSAQARQPQQDVGVVRQEQEAERDVQGAEAAKFGGLQDVHCTSGNCIHYLNENY